MMMELNKGETVGALEFLQAINKGERVKGFQYKVLSNEKWYVVRSVNKKNMTFNVENAVQPIHYSEIVELGRLS